MLKTEEELKQKFDLIPEGTDILICHSPPAGILDRNVFGQSCGSSALLKSIYRVRPRVVVFGHIHESYGRVEKDGIFFVNASTCTTDYRPRNPPVQLQWERGHAGTGVSTF